MTIEYYQECIARLAIQLYSHSQIIIKARMVFGELDNDDIEDVINSDAMALAWDLLEKDGFKVAIDRNGEWDGTLKITWPADQRTNYSLQSSWGTSPRHNPSAIYVQRLPDPA